MKKMMLTMSVVLALGLIAGAAGAAVVNTVDFWFAGDDGVAISALEVAPGADLDLGIYAQTSAPWAVSSIELLAGWANASARGTAAVMSSPFVNRLGDVGFEINITGFNVTANNVGGAKNATTAVEGSGGSHALLTIATPGATTDMSGAPVKLATLKLNAASLMAGEAYALKLWRAATPATMGWSCFLGQTGNQNQELESTELLITGKGETPVIPEPGSMVALGTGLMGLVGFVLRRKA